MTAFLYVEDDRVSRQIMEMVLRRVMGFSDVFLFEDSSNFLSRVAALQPQPDVVFLDIHVEPYDGFEMLRMLRRSERFFAVPIIAMTASVMHEEVQQLKDADFDGAVGKPIDVENFSHVIGMILQGHEVWHVK